jgi:hypothetical protein
MWVGWLLLKKKNVVADRLKEMAAELEAGPGRPVQRGVAGRRIASPGANSMNSDLVVTFALCLVIELIEGK